MKMGEEVDRKPNLRGNVLPTLFMSSRGAAAPGAKSVPEM
jgi:hypothetical protein